MSDERGNRSGYRKGCVLRVTDLPAIVVQGVCDPSDPVDDDPGDGNCSAADPGDWNCDPGSIGR